MKIAVIGAGGVGGTFGAALAQSGADVWFLARGAHLRAMREHGLRVIGGRGDTHVVPAQATDDPAVIGPVDFVLFCVKLWDVESAGEAIRPLIGPGTAVIPLQNGIDAADRLIPILGHGAVMGGVAQVSATIAEPGVIRQTGTFMKLIFGELDGGRTARGEAFLAHWFAELAKSNDSQRADTILSRKDAAKFLHRDVSTIKRWEKDGTLPEPLRIGERGVWHRLSDLKALRRGTADQG